MGIDIYVVFMMVGALGGGSAVGIAWLLWWERRRKRPEHCPGCLCWMHWEADMEKSED